MSIRTVVHELQYIKSRCTRSAPDRSKVGMIVDKGHDFPEEASRQLDSIGAGIHYRVRVGKTTRALNTFTVILEL